MPYTRRLPSSCTRHSPEAGPTRRRAAIEILSDEQQDPDLRASTAWALGVLCDSEGIDWSAAYANDLAYPYLTWTLSSPFGDGHGLLDGRR